MTGEGGLFVLVLAGALAVVATTGTVVETINAAGRAVDQTRTAYMAGTPGSDRNGYATLTAASFAMDRVQR